MIEGLVGGFATEPGLRAQVTLSFEDIEGTKWTRLVGKFRVATRARGTPGLGTAPRKGARRAFFDLGRLVTPRAANVAYQLLDHQLDVGSARSYWRTTTSLRPTRAARISLGWLVRFQERTQPNHDQVSYVTGGSGRTQRCASWTLGSFAVDPGEWSCLPEHPGRTGRGGDRALPRSVARPLGLFPAHRRMRRCRGDGRRRRRRSPRSRGHDLSNLDGAAHWPLSSRRRGRKVSSIARRDRHRRHGGSRGSLSSGAECGTLRGRSRCPDVTCPEHHRQVSFDRTYDNGHFDAWVINGDEA